MKGLTNYQKFLVARPLPPKTKLDKYNNPIINKDDFANINWANIKFISMSNLSSVKERRYSIPIMFHYDYFLERIWNDPIKYFSRLSGFIAITNPDFSVYTDMNIKEIEHNVFRNRWFAVWAQFYHYKVIPTVTWGDETTFDLCFSGLPSKCPVIISTIGCLNCKEKFLVGFKEMKKRIEPSLIIVRGKLIDGMIGNFLVIDFKDTFNHAKLLNRKLPEAIDLKILKEEN